MIGREKCDDDMARSTAAAAELEAHIYQGKGIAEALAQAAHCFLGWWRHNVLPL
jgi:hypothetical protein